MGLMTGYGDGTFGPSDSLTRAQAATILWRYFQPTASKNYNAQAAKNRTKMADVESGCFYTEAANWAVENGVIHGVEKGGELCFVRPRCEHPSRTALRDDRERRARALRAQC